MEEEVILGSGYVTIPGFVNQLSDNLYELQQQGVLCDVRLQGADGYIMAHALILSAASPSLKRLFTGSDTSVIKPLTTESVQDLQNFVRFVYTGKLFLSFSNIRRMANVFKVMEIHDVAKLLQDSYPNLEEEEQEEREMIGLKRKRSESPEQVIDINAEDEELEFNNEEMNQGGDNLNHDTIEYNQNVIIVNENDIIKEIEEEESRSGDESVRSPVMQDENSSFEASSPTSDIQQVFNIKEASPPKDEIVRRSSRLKGVTQSSNNSISSGDPTTQSSTDNVNPSVAIHPSTDSVNHCVATHSCTDNVIPRGATHQRKRKPDMSNKFVVIKKSKDSLDVIPNIGIDKDKKNAGDQTVNSDQTVTKTVTKKRRTKKDKIKLDTKPKTLFCRYCKQMFRKPYYWGVHEEKCLKQKIEKEQLGQSAIEELKNKAIDDKTNVKAKKAKKDWSIYRRKTPCEYCNYMAPRESFLVRHQFLQHGIEFDRSKYKIYNCEFPGCEYFHMSQNFVREHARDRHKVTAGFDCQICQKTFRRKLALQDHMDKYHPDSTGSEESSDESDASTTNFEKCDFCEELFDTENTLVDCKYFHLQQHPLKQHVLEKHSKPGFTCEICGNMFSSKTRLRQHDISHVPKEKRDFKHKCSMCGISFRYQSLLKNHIQIKHSKEKSLLCHHCPYKTAYKREIDIHMYKVHGVPLPDTRKTFNCNLCDYFTFFKRDLEAHINRHNGVKEHICEVCGARFTSRNGLIGHSQRHKEKSECPYEGCTYKGATQEMKKHIFVRHEDVKPYVCDHCGFRTKSGCSLQKHLQSQHNVTTVTKNALWDQMMTTGEGYEAFAQKTSLEALQRASQSKDEHSENKGDNSSQLNIVSENPNVNNVVTLQIDNAAQGQAFQVQNYAAIYPGGTLATAADGSMQVFTIAPQENIHMS